MTLKIVGIVALVLVVLLALVVIARTLVFPPEVLIRKIEIR